ncbi:homeobox protein 2 isoform X3 [Vespula maculifrons]|uniref:Sodium/potassium-transporting ATPase subunit beta-1-interacting protein n=1 Tax=Vespula maculifrons TaxID=7453 RepID=A0ABD2BZB9_VESMC
MGICSRRHFLLTICILQLLYERKCTTDISVIDATMELITTVERQVFDFLGFMWAPILYCIWNTLWLGWNIFMICFYLSVGVLDKNSDILNLGTGSFSWWHVNGPGCKAVYDVTEPELFRPARPSNVTDCVLDYEVVEILHASTQCLLGLMAIIGGICLSKVFLEEDDSFDFIGGFDPPFCFKVDFVGGDDFGLAGHTQLHPMYVSYSALPPPSHPYKNSNQDYPAGTTSSHQSGYRDTTFPKRNDKSFNSSSNSKNSNRNDTIISNRSNLSNNDMKNVEYSTDYSNPLDHLQRPISPYDEYDSLDSAARLKYQKNKLYYPHSSKYVSVTTAKCKTQSNHGKPTRTPSKPRIFTDHIREQPLRSFYSDPKLAIDRHQSMNNHDRPNKSKRESRPLSLCATLNVWLLCGAMENYKYLIQIKKKKKKKQPRPLYSIEYSQPEPPVHDDSVSPKPMTPRRVKRRSVISRDGTRRSSRRSSVRQSRRKNPVNRIMDHQESLYANTAPSNLTNQNVNSLSQGTLNYDRISVSWDRDRNSNWQPEAVNMAVSSPTLWTGQDNNNYSNTSNYSNQNLPIWDGNSSTRNLTDNWQENDLNTMQWQGQSNPTFQQTSTQSLNGEDLEDLYSNRPASARSSYSNYHGVRATPQVPSRTDIVRQSQRQFVLSGPPAYQDTVI